MDGKKTILLIDDEVDLADMLQFQLQAKGYDVVTAHSGVEGLQQLKTLEPDLIVLDINMPEMGGLEFFNKITTGYGQAKYPVLVSTARSNLEGVFESVDIKGFITKPFEINDFLKEVERIIAERHHTQLLFLIDFEDNPHVRALCGNFLLEGFRVATVENFDTLWNRARMESPDFIIMEYMQKGISGEDFIKRIKDVPGLEKTPIIVYSYSGFNYEEKSLDAGASIYVGKPEDYTIFLQAMKKIHQSEQ